jgi:uncharacterized caspase-like protein
MRSLPLPRSVALAALAGVAILTEAAGTRAEPPASTPRPRAYAIVVGDDLGGSGQRPLRFAEDDARRMAQVLTEVGHYSPPDVQLLLRPDAAHLLAAIDEVKAQARSNAERGVGSQVLFYYSGHARANAVNLGADEIAITALRDRLRAVPSTITIVVLDACQSGSFSRVKGAEPAADFSYNSVAGLTQKGLAVMASSTAEELSQESDELKASYFTHHLITGLRGAGDSDGDGRVSLDEAYRYAYRRTLASTARTKVGEQHVTLETDLAGQGEVAVTYPAEAKAQLGLPPSLDAHVLVQLRPSGAVMADLQKAPGAPVRLALIAGSYEAIVSQKSGIVDCRLALADDHVTEVDPAACAPVMADPTSAKGPSSPDALDAEPAEKLESPRPHLRTEVDHWAIESALGFTFRRTDAYTSRLNEFGYQPDGFDPPTGRVALGVSRLLARHVAGVIQLATLAGDKYTRSIADETDTVSFHAYGAAVYVRTFANLTRWFGLYGQAGGGMGMGVVEVDTHQTGVPPSVTTASFGYLLSGAGGFTMRLPYVVTFYGQGEYDYAPVIRNLIGDTHDGGGFSAVLGVRLRLGDDR